MKKLTTLLLFYPWSDQCNIDYKKGVNTNRKSLLSGVLCGVFVTAVALWLFTILI